MAKEKYQCLEDRVLILPNEEKQVEQTASGIYTDMKKKEIMTGVVVEVGLGYTARDTGVFVSTILHTGDLVLFGKDAGMSVDILDEENKPVEHRLMREADVLMMVSKKVDSVL